MPTSPNSRPCLSHHELKMYHEGTLDKKAAHAIEDHLLGCELCGAAVEGFALMPFTIADIPALPLASAAPAQGANLAAMIGIPIAGCILLVSLFDQFRGRPAELLNADTGNISTVEILPDQVVESEKLITDKFEKTEKLNELITKDNEVKDLVTKLVTEKNDLQHFGKQDASVWMMPQKGIETIAMTHDHDPHSKVDGFNVIPLSKDTFIHDLRVTYYRELYFFDMTKYDSYLKSTDAKYETKMQKEGDKALPELTVITTADILDKALENFSKNNFTDALKLFNILIKHEPNDVNALFYAAVCYINLSRAADAMIYLDKIRELDDNSFDQECEWQTANALVQLKEFKRAAGVLETIVSGSGFYSERAKELLKRVKAKIK